MSKEQPTDAWLDSNGKPININDCIRACRQGAMALTAKAEFDEKIKGTLLAEDFKRYAEILTKIREMYSQALMAKVEELKKKAKPKLEVPRER